jgi:ribonuclease Z
MRLTHIMTTLAAAALLAGCAEETGQSACDGGAAGPCTPASYGQVPVSPTPTPTPANCPATPTVLSRLVETQAKSGLDALAANRKALLDPTKLTVVTCGTGNPFPSKRAQACIAVFAGGRFFLFDAGDRAARSMEVLNLPVQDLAAVFITHFHSDHIADLGEVSSRSWILGRATGKLPVYGPEGLQRVVDGFNLVYAPDDRYREAHHGTEIFKPGTGGMKAHPFATPGAGGALVYDSGGVKIKAYAVDHSPITPSIGYRLEYGGRVVGISGDTVDTTGLAALASGADILVSDVLNRAITEDFECAFSRLGNKRTAQMFQDIRTYHIDTKSLAALATKAGVKTLMLVHMTPSANDQAQATLFFSGAIKAGYSGKLVLAIDGTKEVLTVAK